MENNSVESNNNRQNKNHVDTRSLSPSVSSSNSDSADGFTTSTLVCSELTGPINEIIGEVLGSKYKADDINNNVRVRAIQNKEVENLLAKLEYLNGPHAEKIHSAFDALIEDLGVVAEDVTRLEGILARSTDAGTWINPRFVAVFSTTVENFEKVSAKLGPLAEMAMLMEYFSARAEAITGLLNRLSSVNEAETTTVATGQEVEAEDDPKFSFPLQSQIFKVAREIMHRIKRISEELKPRLANNEAEVERD